MVDDYVGRNLRIPSLNLYLPSQMGHDRVDALLHPCNSGLFILFASLFFLENGRLFLGCHSCGARREGKEAYRSCKPSFFVFKFTSSLVCRTKGNLIHVPFLSSLGQITRTSSGIRKATIALDHGFLQKRNLDIPNPAASLYTAVLSTIYLDPAHTLPPLLLA